MTTPPLVKQPRDEFRLEQDYSTNRQDLCTILIPYSQFAKINLASGHQAAFADPPPLHFPPVKFWCCKPGGWYLDVASPLAGNTRRIFSKTARKLCANATTVSFAVR